MAYKYSPNNWVRYNDEISLDEQLDSIISKEKLDHMEDGIKQASIENQIGKCIMDKSTDQPSASYREDLINGIRYLDLTFPGNIATAKQAEECTGNSATATKLETARKISLAGSVTGAALFDGSQDVTINAALAKTYAGSDTDGGDANTVKVAATTANSTYYPTLVSSSATNKLNYSANIQVNPSEGGLTLNTLNATNINIGSSIVLPNNSFIKAKNSSGTSYNILGIDSSNNTIVGGTSGDTSIVANSNKTIIFKIGSNNVASIDNTGLYSGTAASANKVNNNLIITLNNGSTEGTNKFTFNGSTDKSIDINPSSIGASASDHTHLYAGSSTAGGVANSAEKLSIARTIALSGVISGSTTFDGSADKTISTSYNIETISSGTVDLNNYKTTGMYCFTSGANISNIPPGCSNGLLLVFSLTDNNVKQIFNRYGTSGKNDSQLYVRTYNSNGWGIWNIYLSTYTYQSSGDTLDLNLAWTPGIYLWNSDCTVSNLPSEASISRGVCLALTYNMQTNYKHGMQLLFSSTAYESGTDGYMYVRSGQFSTSGDTSTNTWSTWKKVYTSTSISYGTGDPSGGRKGDIYFKYS